MMCEQRDVLNEQHAGEHWGEVLNVRFVQAHFGYLDVFEDIFTMASLTDD